ncbi:hypothetical protein [Serratia odorifera]|jgi:hypothetical protein|uniref:Uncharacterized protein n=2 Tax=Serratia odorifera TaxID=618 RepID=D4E507_SEROD|nr:hypothetical protein [Serratia odorifera]EFE95203.1 hypothetical protein HMPREF0758_3257 [Serratia odorifera DSM 4582]PNK89854.1 hypothetical protein CEQ31_009085 [Serratia odorifera]RII70563.1 hypothetical protein DX901_17235 [Serratia odorifera]VDZ61852.1 Uncharacterised protein [Serratia odorifera]HEJ9094108.1 hypothetical protein [Serratia odorifera]
MKNGKLLGGIGVVFATALLLFCSLDSVGHSARLSGPVMVMKEGTVLFALNASMQQNRQLDGQYQHARGLFQQAGGKLHGGMQHLIDSGYFA